MPTFSSMGSSERSIMCLGGHRVSRGVRGERSARCVGQHNGKSPAVGTERRAWWRPSGAAERPRLRSSLVCVDEARPEPLEREATRGCVGRCRRRAVRVWLGAALLLHGLRREEKRGSPWVS